MPAGHFAGIILRNTIDEATNSAFPWWLGPNTQPATFPAGYSNHATGSVWIDSKQGEDTVLAQTVPTRYDLHFIFSNYRVYLSPMVKQTAHEADHPIPSSTELLMQACSWVGDSSEWNVNFNLEHTMKAQRGVEV
jgi:hypothetical protein